VQLGVLHYRGRGRCAGVAEARGGRTPRFGRFVAIFRVARVHELLRAVGRLPIRLALPIRLLLLLLLLLLLARRIRTMIVARALRDVVLVVVRIRDLVHRLRHAQIRDLMEAGLAGGRADEGRVGAPRWRDLAASLSILLRLAPIGRRALVLPVLPVTIVPPIRRVSTRRLSTVVIAVIRLLLLLLLVPTHRGQMIARVVAGLVVHQAGRSAAVSVDEGGLQGTNYRGMVEAAR